MTEPVVPPPDQEDSGWEALRADAPHPIFRFFAGQAKARKLSIWEVANRCGRDRKNLKRSMYAQNPHPETIRAIGQALGFDEQFISRLIEFGTSVVPQVALENFRETRLLVRQIRDDGLDEFCLQNIYEYRQAFLDRLEIAIAQFERAVIERNEQHLELARRRCSAAFKADLAHRKMIVDLMRTIERDTATLRPQSD